MNTRFALQQLPLKVPSSAMEHSPHACFALTESLDICYCNAAWDRFAAENGGGSQVKASSVMDKPLMHYVPGELASVIKGLFKSARTLGRPQMQDYECSSAQVYRLYRMQVYPLHTGYGFAVINSLRVAQPHTRVECDPVEANYLQPDGLMRMCANCRRARRLDNPLAWDWVPDFVEHARVNVSHGAAHSAPNTTRLLYQGRKARTLVA